MENVTANSEMPEVPNASAGRTFGGHFQEQRLLKRGQTTETLYGVDRTSGESVVIKTVASDSVSSGVRMRLEHEAEILRKIDSPQLAPLLSVGLQDGWFYMVSRYQPGVTLEAVLRERSLSVAETLTLARAVLSALQVAHERGVLHRDIKPANVVLAEAVPVQHAVLVDFGFAHSAQLDPASGEQLLSTVRYMSPELAGSLAVEVSTSSDLYSAGVMLYECLAGHPPFDGRSVGEVLRQHMTVQPPEVRTLGVKVPRALDEVLQRLLCKDPRDRYQTAAAVLADIETIRQALQRGEEEPSLVVGLQDSRQTLTEPTFVGRDAELQSLAAHVAKAQKGVCGLVLLEGESGGGKTRLLTELAVRCTCQKIAVFRGRASDQIAQRPFQVLDEIVDDLVAACSTAPQLASVLRERLGDHRAAVLAVLPRLAEVLGEAPSEELGPEAFGEPRTLESLVSLLRALGSKERPAVVLLDDCQWAGEPMLKLLERWLIRKRIDRGSPCHVCVVAAFRSEEVTAGHLLRKLLPSGHLTLSAFGSEDIRRLVESMAGKLPNEAVEIITRMSSGSPFMASAVLRGMVESKALIAGPKGWRIERSAMEDVRSSRHAGELLARRLRLLPLVVMDLLKAGAILGKEFDLSLAASLAGLMPRVAVVAQRQAQARHLVWTRPDDERCVFVHDKVRETCLATLSEDERRELHVRAAALLEPQTPLPVFDLAYHYDLAGQSAKALGFALTAAEQARSQHSPEIAEQQYRIAVRGCDEAEQATRYRIAEGLGDVLMLRGRYDGARQMFEVAKFLAQGDIATVKAKIEGKLGELAFKRGDMKTAAAALERGLRYLGRRVPRNRIIHACLLTWEIAVQLMHTACPGLCLGRRKLTSHTDKDLLAIRLYSRLTHAYWFAGGSAGGKVPNFWRHLRALNLAERFPPTLELGQVYSDHAPGMSLIGRFSRGISYAEKSFKIRKEMGDSWGQAQSLHYHGVILYAASRFEECIEKCRQAVRLFGRTGDFWEMHIARYQIAASLYRLGDLPGAVAEAQLLHKSGLEFKDFQASGISLDIWAWATRGKAPVEALQVELRRTRDDAQATAQVRVADGVRWLGAGQPEKAVRALKAAWRAIRAKGINNAWVSPVLPWLATAIRQQAEGLPPYARHRRDRLLRLAGRVVRAALCITRRFRNDLPHALREKGLLSALQADGRAARRYLEQSLQEARRQGARYEYAQSLSARGRVGRGLGWSGAARDLAEGQRLIGELERGILKPEEDSSDTRKSLPTLSLVDRFDTLLDAGRKIASALDREAVFGAVQEGALRLLRGEQCQIIPAPGAGWPLAEQVFRAKQTVVHSESSANVRLEELGLPGVRSVLCTPVFVRGQAAACFCVTHRHVLDLFRDDEVRLAEFIAAIAGAALENAAGYAELQRLNVTLEQRVAERTADLEASTKELANSNAELEQFAYVASHDLQEPLRTVTSYCRLLEENCQGHLDAKTREYMDQVLDGAQRMRTLISDLLTYSRVGRRGRPFQPTDCNAVLDLALSNLKLTIEETGAVVTRTPLPEVLGDPTQLLQLFQNLLGNAIKFRKAQPPHVDIQAERSGAEWVFSVRDDGIGIEPEHLERIFLIFHRLHTREEYPGTGIGLAVCKKTVERHGGRIWVESRPGEGSTFRFALAAMPKSRETSA